MHPTATFFALARYTSERFSYGWVVQYLKERFDVPGMLLPALSELVASLVFRQARTLVLGYDGSRVKKSDRIWREKVSTGTVG